MCFKFVKSKTFRWARLCVLWSILLLFCCLYVFHFKKTVVAKRDFALDYSSHDTIQGSRNMVNVANDVFSQGVGDNTGDTISYFTRDLSPRDGFNITSGRIDKDLLKAKINEFIDNIQSTDHFDNYNNIKNNNSNQQVRIYPSSNPLYDEGVDSEASQNRHQTPLMKKNKFIPNYEDIVTRYLSNLGPNAKASGGGYEALPSQYKVWNVHWTIRNAGMYPKTLYCSPPGEYPTQRLPKAILIGAGKCGTRALIEFLGMHPNVVTARNEIHYFDREENFNKSLNWYIEQMPLSYSNQITVEKSPSYIWSYEAMKEIRQMNKDVKLLVILRDPVERVISQAIRTKHVDFKRVFLDRDMRGDVCVRNQSNTVMWSVYVKYLRRWMDVFPAEQIHIVESKEFAADPAKELQQIERFLGLSALIKESNIWFNKTKGFNCMRPLHLQHDIVCLSDGKGREHPKLDPRIKKLLYDYFRPFNEELFSLLGRRFQWDP